ncbi:HIT family protein [Streptomyces angustmyceticus]
MTADLCPFCEIAAGQAPATAIREWSDALAIVPLGPVVDGHLLVIPKTHVADFTAGAYVSAMTMHRAAELAAESRQPMNLITSRGREATQSVFHLNLHLIPRAADDGLALPWHSGHAPATRMDRFQRMAETAARAVNNALAADQAAFALAPSPDGDDAHPLARLRAQLVADRDQAIRNARDARHEHVQLAGDGIVVGLDGAIRRLDDALGRGREAGDRSGCGPRAGDPSIAGHSPEDPSGEGAQ